LDRFTDEPEETVLSDMKIIDLRRTSGEGQAKIYVSWLDGTEIQDTNRDFQKEILRWGGLQTAPNEAFSTTPIPPRYCSRAPLAHPGLFSAGLAGEWGDRDAGCKMPCGEVERGVDRNVGLWSEVLAASILLSGEERGK
jgi:hypothetical protein